VAQPLTAASGVAPLTLVKQLVAQVLSIVKDKQMVQPDKQKKLRELGAANFDFNEMSRLAMGKSWRSLSADQRQRFVPVFTYQCRRSRSAAVICRSFASRSESWRRILRICALVRILLPLASVAAYAFSTPEALAT
jgi:hypothetical protein